MENNKLFKVIVKKVEYPTNGLGLVLAVMRLTKTFEYKLIDENNKKTKASFDAITISNISTIFDNQITKGSSLFITVSDRGEISIRDFKKPKTPNRILVPYTCMSCGTKLKRLNKDQLVCDNLFCTASDRGSIFKLIDHVCTDYALIDAYLDNFPTKEGTVKINNLMEYLHHFKLVGPKNIAPREVMFEAIKELKKAVNDKELYDLVVMERNLEKLLTEKQDNAFYWRVLNIPNIKIHELEKFKPHTITANQINSFKTKKKIATLMNGKRYFKIIMKLFKNLEDS